MPSNYRRYINPRPLLWALAGFWIFLMLPLSCFAQDYADDPFEYDHDVGVVGRKNFDASNRFDFSVYGGGNFFNILIDDYMVGGGLRYYFADWWGLELRGIYHFFEMTNDALLAESIASASASNSFYIDFVQLESLGHIVLVPFYGKHHLWGTAFVNYQLYTFLGGGVLSLNQVVLLPAPHVFTYGGSFGLGFKFYLNEIFNLAVEVRELVYRDQSFDDSQWSSQFAVNLGLGFTLPTFDTPKRKI